MADTILAAGRRSTGLAAGAALTIALAACGAAASPSSSNPPMSMEGSTSTAPRVSVAPSPSGPLRCAVTADASPSATIGVTIDSLGIFDYGDPVTIAAGQAVVFVNGSQAAHTITEGIYGQAAAVPCVNVPLAVNTSVIVTFYLPGEYQITCRPHKVMGTTVTVQ